MTVAAMGQTEDMGQPEQPVVAKSRLQSGRDAHIGGVGVQTGLFESPFSGSSSHILSFSLFFVYVAFLGDRMVSGKRAKRVAHIPAPVCASVSLTVKAGEYPCPACLWVLQMVEWCHWWQNALQTII